MADFSGCLSSTSFRVKDREAFLADPDVQVIKSHAQYDGFFEFDAEGYVAFGWYGQYPSLILSDYHVGENGEEDTEEEWSIPDIIARHILPGDVCQLGISGNEKLRYIGGTLCWVTASGVAHFDAETCWETRLTEASLHDLMVALGDQIDGLLTPHEPPLPPPMVRTGRGTPMVFDH